MASLKTPGQQNQSTGKEHSVVKIRGTVIFTAIAKFATKFADVGTCFYNQFSARNGKFSNHLASVEILYGLLFQTILSTVEK